MADSVFLHFYYMDGIRYDQVFAYTFSTIALIYAVEIAVPALVLLCVPNHIVKAIAKILLVVSLLIVGFIPGIMSGLNVIGGLSAWFYTFIIFLLPCAMILRHEVVSKKLKTEEDAKFRSFLRSLRVSLVNKTISTRKFYSIIGVVVFAPLLFPYFLDGMCVSFFNTLEGGMTVAKDTNANTAFTRRLFMDPACPIGSPCQVYATLPEDTSTGVILNFHTHASISSILIDYDEKTHYEKNGFLEKTAISQATIVSPDSIGKRAVHHVYLKGLKPDTTYIFEAEYLGKIQYTGVYKTLPGYDSHKSLKIVVGGDSGSTPTARNMTKLVSAQKPDLIIIGGDTAYDNAIQACWACWDNFLKMFNQVNEEAGRLIPLIFALGNHDIGYNAKSGVKPNPKAYSLYFHYVPQHIEGNVVPHAKSRKSYFAHKVRDMVFFSMDSMYLKDYDEEQHEWLREKCKYHDGFKKFAIYHAPLVPATLRYHDHLKEFVQKGADVWGKIFEEYHFSGVFENHNHNFKRTKPLFGHKVDYENGVRYFGDGAWGVPPVAIKPTNTNDPDLFENMGSLNHVWIIESTKKSLKIYPMNIKGEFFAEPTIMLNENYIDI